MPACSERWPRWTSGTLAKDVDRDVRRSGVEFGGTGEVEPFRLDLVPRVITADEWALLERGLAQRVRALDRFVADAYGKQEIVEAGVLPGRVLESCDHFERRLVGLPAPPVRVAIAGLDLVRDRDGRFHVLEDNVRTPSGTTYTLAARETLDRHLPSGLAERRRPLDDVLDTIAETLRAAAPEGVDDPSIVVLSDGPSNSAWYEHERIARALSIPVVTCAELSVSGDRLIARVNGRRMPVDVVYRRTNEDRLEDERGKLTDVGAALFAPLRAGRVTCVNAFGAGVADDKLMHAYVEKMVRFYLAEEPLLGSVRTYDVGVPDVRSAVLERIDELVIKPRAGYGGVGVVVPRTPSRRTCGGSQPRSPAIPKATWPRRRSCSRATRRPPDGRLEPRHIDLRPFVLLAGDTARVVPGGLTRVALEPGRAGREQLARGRRQGHVGAVVSRPPLVGVSTSEVRRAADHSVVPQGEPSRRELALGERYLDSVRSAGGLPVILTPVHGSAIDPLLDAARRRLPVRRARPAPVGLWGGGAREARPDRAGARPVRARAGAAGGPPRRARARHLPRRAGAERGARRHPASAPSRPVREVEHRQQASGRQVTHEVKLASDSRLAKLMGRTEVGVNSFHHQAPATLGPGLRAVGRAADGTVEALESGAKGFVFGVQWHAEGLVEMPEHFALFEGLVQAGAEHSAAELRAA